jgi:hypothetical protein
VSHCQLGFKGPSSDFSDGYRCGTVQSVMRLSSGSSPPPGQFFVDLLFELLFGHFPRPMQPGCTIEVLPVPPGQRGQLDSLSPADFLQLFSRLRRVKSPRRVFLPMPCEVCAAPAEYSLLFAN